MDTEWKKILVPTDGSEPASLAMKAATRLAQLTGGEICLLMVADTRHLNAIKWDYLDPSSREDVEKRMVDDAYRKLKEFYLEYVEDEEIEVEWVVVKGNPTREILNFAKINEFDVIVVGFQDKSTSNLLGAYSISEHIIRFADCPVLSVKFSNPEYMLFRDHQEMF